MHKKVLFIDTTHTVLEKELSEMGYTCEYFPEYKRQEFINCIHEYFGVIVRSKIRLDKEILEKAENLKFIGRPGSGLENIDVKFAESKGIKCVNSPEGNRLAVGEHALGMLLSLFNNICKSNQEVRIGKWDRVGNRGIELNGKTVGIIGYGNTGSAFAQNLKGFDVNIIAYDKYKSGFSNEFVKEVSLNEIFEFSDILSLHIPLTDETHYLINDKFINQFIKQIFFINTSRGPIVNTTELVKNLKSGKVLGAALDVLEYEKLSFEMIELNSIPDVFKYLINSENVLLSPHIAGSTHDSNYKIAKVIADKVRQEFHKS
ncbi:MAG: hydroxyacid dehydrogenase [Saprospiraceae bacterium]|nr:hydroxyacid dehydrogenase [Saprospiraceae bacterium]